MAREFNGTNQYLNTASTPVTGVPLTIAVWFNSNSITTNQAIFCVGNATSATQGYRLFASGAANLDPIVADISGTNLGTLNASTSSGYSLAAWQHACGVYTQINISAYLNGGNVGSTAINPTTFPSVNNLTVGARLSLGTPGIFLNGRLAEVGIWDAALTAAEVASLAKGMTCDKVRPQNLVLYAPLVRDLIDQKGGRAITNNNNATVANHPRIYP